MIIKEYSYGERHFQKLFIDGTKIVDATCNCSWSLNNSRAFREGDTLCKHIICAIREFNLEMNKERRKYGNKRI